MTHPTEGLWRHRDFLRLWSSQTLSLFGAQFGQLALPLVAILTLHASAVDVGVLIGLPTLPWVMFGLLVGVGIDRLPRRPVLIVAHVGRAVVLGTVAFTALNGSLSLWQLYVAALICGTLNMCFEVAYHSYLPSLVTTSQLADGNGKLAVTDGLTRTAGPSIAGSVVQVFTAPAALGVQGLLYFLAGCCLWRIRASEPRRLGGTEEIMRSMRKGLSFTWQQTLVRAFTFSEATYLFFFDIMSATVLVFYSRNLGLRPAAIGLIFSAGSVGGIVGALAAARAGKKFRPGPTIMGGSLLRGLGVAVVPLSAFVGTFAVPMLVGARLINAFGWTLWDVHQETTLQLVTPDRLRGRVNGSSLFLIRTAEALGGLAGAGVIALFGVVPTLTIGTLGALLATAWLLLAPVWGVRSEAPGVALSAGDNSI